MWRHYLRSGWASLARSRAYSLINLVGLSLGLAASLIILIHVRYELSYDSWLPGAERAFVLQQWVTASDDPNVIPGAVPMTSYVSGQRLRQFPQLDRVVYVGNGQPIILQDGEATTSEDFVYVDGPLFDILQLEFLRGDRAGALAAPGQLVLTRSEAIRRFGTIDAVGRTLTLVVAGQSSDHRVTGIVEDVPRNSHLALSIVARADFEALYGADSPFLTQWMPKNGWVYARLRPGADAAEIARQMPAWERRNIPDQLVGGERVNPGTNVDWRLANVRDVHLGEAGGGGMRPGNDRATVAAMALIGLLILALAVVNFVNLATARAGQRAREVALRKVVGASRRQLVAQFLGESTLLAAAAMLVALALVEAALPFVNAFLDAEMEATYFALDGMLAPAAALVLLVGALGGLYPALYLSRFQPARVLKANRSTAEPEGTGRLRNALVVSQFAISIGLIVCTAVIQAQTEYARTVDPGYRRDGILQIGQMSRAALRPRLETLLREIAAVDGIVSVGRSTIGVDTWGMENLTVTAPGASASVEFEHYRVDPGFFPTLRIETLAGRTFSAGLAMDDSTQDPDSAEGSAAAMARRGYNVVINALAARMLGYRDPSEAVGRTLMADDGDVEAVGRTPVTVVGVVANSRFRSIRDPVAPMIFAYDRFQPSWLLVRYSGRPALVRDRLEQVWKRIAPDVPFEAEFADDIVRDLYSGEAARARIFAAFSLLAVAIGCLGLYGLAAFTAERRTREIGIRKVLGARTWDIVKLLVWQFGRPVLVANLIAWPVAWWAMSHWLSGFDLRIALGPLPFAAAGALALVIASATVLSHAVKVARTRPIHALRYE
ncbi:MAG TPA: FtsX-like permease family protein [Allosphingosinicella sp.]|nr:FtsX-like permease family protein [Allosphingosinicella sp.]